MAAEVQLPSVQLDLVREDLGDATQGTLLSGNTETFALNDGDVLSVDVDGGGAQNVTFHAVDFVDITEATADEVVTAINAQLVGGTAAEESGAVRVSTDTYGAAGSIEVTSEPAGTPFAFPVGAQAGTDATDVTQLINRIPEPDEPGVPVDSDVVVEVHDTGGAPPSTDVKVFIDGTLAYDGNGGGFQSGFTGTTSNPDALTFRVVVDPDSDFDSDSDVEVRVTSAGVSTGLDETYTFSTEDISAPRVDAAQAQDKKTVRVTFNEPVKQVSPSNADDALNPSNYSFMRNSAPAVDIEAVEVEAVSDAEVDVTLDFEMSFGASYTVSVGNVEDLFDNPVVVPNDEATFLGFQPPFPPGRRFDLLRFLPQLNREEDATRELRNYALIKQDVVNLLLCEIDGFTDILDPDIAPGDFLDLMLLDLGNPFDFIDLSTVDKRRLLRVLLDIYKQKGTEQGIVNVINFFVGVLVTLDVFNGDGFVLGDEPTLDGRSPPVVGSELSKEGEVAPGAGSGLGPDSELIYTFDIISPVNLTETQRRRILAICELMKPAHTHCNRIIEPTPEEPEPTGDELGFGELSDGVGKPGDPPWTLS